jgi:hypothetical protein
MGCCCKRQMDPEMLPLSTIGLFLELPELKAA